MKQGISNEPVFGTVGFLYWLHETHNLRGLKGVSIEDYPSKLASLKVEYSTKYPNGLTGWSKS